MDRFTRVPVREQPADLRNKNFDEVCYGYDKEEAMKEAARCLKCKVPQCRKGCPVNIDIPKFIKAIEEDDPVNAAKIIGEYSALPAVCGRVCPQENQCEKYCVLNRRGDSVSIGKLERYVADYTREYHIDFTEKVPSNGRKVAVVGAGPAGLTCAGELAKEGYEVTVFEALQEPGGVLVYGIPEFRLPDRVVRSEVENLKKLGVNFETNVIIGRTITVDELFEEGFESVFLGTGAGLPRFMNIPGENLNGVFSANELLTRANLMKAFDPDYDTPVKVGETTAIIGGGNVAMDAARVSKRLGADVNVIYRRTEKELPARVEEVHHAKEEGIQFHLLSNPIAIHGDEDGWVKEIECIKMELGEPDESGRRRPIPIEGSEFRIKVDTVVMALGTSPNPLIASTTPGLETNQWDCIVADEKGETTHPGVFSGGDAVTGAATVILAMGAGKTAAAGMIDYLESKEK
ncbi:MAG: NADPH-dependent glutamate synthase [Tissierellia bacterium]|nr:NADPH-dependent glutamate synthase [Tissierellia bacterium]